MKSKTFLILVIVLCVLGVATWFVLDSEKPAKKASLMGQKLFEELPLQDIAAVEIASYEDGELQTVKLEKDDSGWSVAERFGYPADFKSISDLVEKFAESKIGRAFEGSADSLDRLQLNPPDKQDAADDSKGLRVKLLEAGDKPAADVIVGKDRESSSGTGGHYLKTASDNTVYLVDQSFRFIDKKPREWIKTDLLDIKSNEVESVVCISSEDNSTVYEAMRPEKGKDPELRNALADRKLKPRSVNSLFDVLSSLKVQDVAGPSEEVPDEKTGFATLPRLQFRLFDGTIYRLYPGKKAGEGEEGSYLKVEVVYSEPEQDEEKTEKDNSAEASDAKGDASQPPEVEIAKDEQPGDAEATEPADEINPEELAYEAQVQNEKLSKWVYVVSDWEHKSMITDPEEFYEEKEPETAPKEDSG